MSKVSGIGLCTADSVAMSKQIHILQKLNRSEAGSSIAEGTKILSQWPLKSMGVFPV